MMVDHQPAAAIFTLEEIERITGLPEAALRNAEPSGFGCPGHWRIQGGRILYTARGVEALAESLDILGERTAAFCLQKCLRQLRPAGKPRKLWFQEGAME